MRAKRRGWMLLGAGLLLAAAGLIAAIFAMLSRTDQKSIYLWENAQTRQGWRYETLSAGQVAQVEAVYPDEFSAYVPGQAVDAIRMSRVMTEDMRRMGEEQIYPLLMLEPYDTRVEVFLDGTLLASDLGEGDRDENGFCILTEAERAAMAPEYRKVTVSLPADYLGRTLTIVTYYAAPREDPVPSYPTLSTDGAQYATFVVSATPEIAKLTACAILTMLILTVFFLDASGGEPEYRNLLMALFFLLTFLDMAYRSAASMDGVLYEKMNLSFLSGLYLAPVYLYLALYFTGWKRIVLSAAAVLWALCEGTEMFLRVRGGEICS